MFGSCFRKLAVILVSGSVDSCSKEVLFFLALFVALKLSSGRCHAGSLFTNEEKGWPVTYLTLLPHIET